ncbi:MAG: FecR domain-containing protein, partial [Planctomycetota bacterium]
RKAGQVFQVSTPLGQTQVLGTRFSVRYEGSRSLTTVVSGRVAVRGEGSDRLAFATRGEQVVLSRAGRAPATQRVDLYRELSWALGPAPEESPLAPEPGATSRPGTTPAAGARPSGAEPDAGADMPIGPPR